MDEGPFLVPIHDHSPRLHTCARARAHTRALTDIRMLHYTYTLAAGLPLSSNALTLLSLTTACSPFKSWVSLPGSPPGMVRLPLFLWYRAHSRGNHRGLYLAPQSTVSGESQINSQH